MFLMNCLREFCLKEVNQSLEIENQFLLTGIFAMMVINKILRGNDLHYHTDVIHWRGPNSFSRLVWCRGLKCGESRSLLSGQHKGSFEKAWTGSEPNIARNLRYQERSLVKTIEVEVGTRVWDSPTLKNAPIPSPSNGLTVQSTLPHPPEKPAWS